MRFSAPVRAPLKVEVTPRGGDTVTFLITLPRSGFSTPPIILSRVDLPAPFSPSTAVEAPR